jgi:hypothetical protein
VRGRSYVAVAVLAAAIAWWWLASPTPPRRESIVVAGGMVAVENQTDREWRNVIVTVNDHFHGGTRSLAAGQRLDAPLGQFKTGHGRFFDRGRMSVSKVVVAATDSDGQPVRLEWAAPSKNQ